MSRVVTIEDTSGWENHVDVLDFVNLFRPGKFHILTMASLDTPTRAPVASQNVGLQRRMEFFTARHGGQ